MTSRSFTVSGSLVRHQVKQYLKAEGVAYDERQSPNFWLQAEFTVEVDDEQWARIQEWVKKVQG